MDYHWGNFFWCREKRKTLKFKSKDNSAFKKPSAFSLILFFNYFLHQKCYFSCFSHCELFKRGISKIFFSRWNYWFYFLLSLTSTSTIAATYCHFKVKRKRWGRSQRQSRKTPNVENPNDKTPNDKTPNDKTPNVKTPNVETPNDKTPKVETPNDKTPNHPEAQSVDYRIQRSYLKSSKRASNTSNIVQSLAMTPTISNYISVIFIEFNRRFSHGLGKICPRALQCPREITSIWSRSFN